MLKYCRWTQSEDKELLDLTVTPCYLNKNLERKWHEIAIRLGKTAIQCRGRWNYLKKNGLQVVNMNKPVASAELLIESDTFKHEKFTIPKNKQFPKNLDVISDLEMPNSSHKQGLHCTQKMQNSSGNSPNDVLPEIVLNLMSLSESSKSKASPSDHTSESSVSNLRKRDSVDKSEFCNNENHKRKKISLPIFPAVSTQKSTDHIASSFSKAPVTSELSYHFSGERKCIPNSSSNTDILPPPSFTPLNAKIATSQTATVKQNMHQLLSNDYYNKMLGTKWNVYNNINVVFYEKMRSIQQLVSLISSYKATRNMYALQSDDYYHSLLNTLWTLYNEMNMIYNDKIANLQQLAAILSPECTDPCTSKPTITGLPRSVALNTSFYPHSSY